MWEAGVEKTNSRRTEQRMDGATETPVRSADFYCSSDNTQDMIVQSYISVVLCVCLLIRSEVKTRSVASVAASHNLEGLQGRAKREMEEAQAHVGGRVEFAVC